jgi:hypothetical protein
MHLREKCLPGIRPAFRSVCVNLDAMRHAGSSTTLTAFALLGMTDVGVAD